MLVQPQQAATVCELDLVQHTIGSSKRAQTLDPNQRPENSHEPLNLTLDLEHAYVSSHSPSEPATPNTARIFSAAASIPKGRGISSFMRGCRSSEPWITPWT